MSAPFSGVSLSAPARTKCIFHCHHSGTSACAGGIRLYCDAGVLHCGCSVIYWQRFWTCLTRGNAGCREARTTSLEFAIISKAKKYSNQKI